jgi:hypothetical protein
VHDSPFDFLQQISLSVAVKGQQHKDLCIITIILDINSTAETSGLFGIVLPTGEGFGVRPN